MNTDPEFAVDPICGMRVRIAKARFKSGHGGGVRYFCAEACKKKFDASPEKYLSRAAPDAADPFAPFGAMPREAEPHAAASGSPAPRASRWICPMCPGVDEPKPGPCPVCGMPLEPALDAAAPPSGADHYDTETAALRRRFLIGAVLALPVFVYSMFLSTPGTAAHEAVSRVVAPSAAQWMMLFLTTPVVFGVGGPFFRAGFAGARRGAFNMFTLIAIGVAAAWSYSVFAVAFPDRIPEPMLGGAHGSSYFDTAATITVLVVLGQWLEARARRRASAAIRELLDLRPVVAHRVDGAGETDVPVDAVIPGDRLRVRPGEKIPVDGECIDGASSIDESSMTGEPLPRDVGAGALVLAGTLNTSGSFIMRASRVGSEMMLSQIVAAVERAQRSRAPIARLADRVTQWFVPAVVAASAAAFAGWILFGPEPRLAFALVSGVSVLVFACPCALGLATPTAIIAGAGRAARRGVLVRDAAALEIGERVNVLVVDKTGTVTEGRPAVRALFAADGVTEERLLAFAAGVERPSEHPLARAISAECERRGLAAAPIVDFRAEVGKGASARSGSAVVRVGTRVFAESDGASFGDVEARATPMRSEGATLIFVAAGSEALGAVALADAPRANSAAAIAALERRGVRVIMATGDQEATARAVASKMNIREVAAGLTPLDKARLVAHERAAGNIVAFAGDGMNDAPALAAADAGMALAGGSGVALEAAAMTVLRGDLEGVVEALDVSRATMRVVRQNLFWAFAYNVAGLPLAAGLGAAAAAALGAADPFAWLVSPLWASAAMTLSSLFVVMNSLRLARL